MGRGCHASLGSASGSRACRRRMRQSRSLLAEKVADGRQAVPREAVRREAVARVKAVRSAVAWMAALRGVGTSAAGAEMVEVGVVGVVRAEAMAAG